MWEVNLLHVMVFYLCSMFVPCLCHAFFAFSCCFLWVSGDLLVHSPLRPALRVLYGFVNFCVDRR